MNPNRRRFLLGATSSVALVAIGACGGSSGGGDTGGSGPAPTPPPSPLPSPTPSPTPTPTPTSATTRLVLWGDSRTQGIGDVSPGIFSDLLAALIPSVAVVNAGVSGQTAAEVVARQGGAPTRLTLSGGAIPTSGPVVVASASVNIFAFALDPNAAGSFEGTLAGVRGTYAADGAGRQTFTRATAGSVVPVAAGTPFLTSLGEESRDDAMFLCVGRNGIETERAEDVVEFTRLAVEHLSTADRRYVVAGVMPDLTATTGGGQRAPYDRLNALLRTTWGAAYLDLATPPTDAEMAAIGYAPSAADRADIAAGVYPRGMFQDTIHLRAAGQRIWAVRVRDHLRGRGYIAG